MVTTEVFDFLKMTKLSQALRPRMAGNGALNQFRELLFNTAGLDFGILSLNSTLNSTFYQLGLGRAESGIVRQIAWRAWAACRCLGLLVPVMSVASI